MNYIVCSSPRSGSTLLSQALVTMGAGNPGEYLNPALMGEPEHGGPDRFMKPTPTGYVERIKQEHTVNGVFGIKTHYKDLMRHPEIGNNVSGLFPHAKYISITRRNVLRQALSAARAAQTMAWTSRLREDKRARFKYGAVCGSPRFQSSGSRRNPSIFALHNAETRRNPSVAGCANIYIVLQSD